MDQMQPDQSQAAAPAAPNLPAAEVAPATTQPALTGVPAPAGYEGPWPKPGMDSGNPLSWIE